MYNQPMRAKFPVTVHLLFFREDQVLLLRRFNTGYADGQYSVPAGHLEGGETVMAAAAREANNMSFSTVMHRIEDEERVDFFINVDKWRGEPYNAEPDKCDDLCWVDVNELPQNTVPYVRQALGNHLAGIRFAEFRM
jgi:ADP-ribose pyrophosphatase YjhB (NUDIX family)